MNRRRFLLIFGIACVFTGSLLMLLKTPTQSNAWLPKWIAQVKPTHTGRTYSNVTRAATVEYVSDNETRMLSTSMSDIQRKLDDHFKSHAGWKRMYSSSTMRVWAKLSSKESQAITVLPGDNGVVIRSMQSHQLNWLEKAQRSIQNMLGVREENPEIWE